MALMTGEQYIESIKKINMQVYMFGKKIEDPTEDPILASVPELRPHDL